MPDDYEPILTLFFAGRLPNLNHARHLAVARILKTMPHGLALMHLGLQITAIRAGVPEKYSAETTDRCWDEVHGAPSLSDFADVI